MMPGAHGPGVMAMFHDPDAKILGLEAVAQEREESCRAICRLMDLLGR